jgi:hypothetical protein
MHLNDVKLTKFNYVGWEEKYGLYASSCAFLWKQSIFYRVYNDAVGAQKGGAQEKRLAHPIKISFFAMFLSLVMPIVGTKTCPPYN